VDIGGRLGFSLYPYEGALGFFQPVTPGLRAQFLLRVKFVQSGRISFGINFEPGFFVYFPSIAYRDAAAAETMRRRPVRRDRWWWWIR
jgi:hypothetical protein